MTTEFSTPASRSSGYLEAAARRVVIFDGAMGTNLQLAELTEDDFGGPELEGCNELLVVSRPEVVDRIHRSFFEVGMRRGRDRHLRCLRTGAGRVRTGSPGPGAEPGRRRPGPRGSRGLLHARPAPVGGRQHRARYQVPHARPDPLRRSPRRLPGAGRGPDRGRRRLDRHRDGVRPVAGQGGHQRRPAGHEGLPAATCPSRPRSPSS